MKKVLILFIIFILTFLGIIAIYHWEFFTTGRILPPNITLENCDDAINEIKKYDWDTGIAIAVMKAEGAVAVISHSQLGKLEGIEKSEFLKEQLESYKEKYMNSKMVLERNFVDGEIEPSKTREILYQDLIRLSGMPVTETVKKKHGNMPV